MFAFARRALVLLPFAAAACGGGDSGGTGPSGIASITVTSPIGGASVGNSIQFTAIAKNANGTAVAGVTFTWQSSDTTLATVSNVGLVTAIAPGAVVITAAAQGKTGTAGFSVLDVPVLRVDITPARPSVGVTGTVILTATPRDAAGRALARTVTWTVSDPTKLSISSTSGNRITATGLTIGSGVVATATSGGVSGADTLSVVAGTSPTITSVSPNPMVAGASATINGVNFDAAIGNNTVMVDDLPATVTAASATQLTITVPASGFTCSAVRDAPVQVVSAGLFGAALAPLDPATVVTLAVGQSTFFDASALSGGCVKLPVNGGASYLLSLTNTNEQFFSSGGFLVYGANVAAMSVSHAAPLPAFDVNAAVAMPAVRATTVLSENDGIDWKAYSTAHRRLLERDRAITAKRGGPRAAHAALARRSRVAAAAFNPSVGDTLNVRIDDINNDQDCTKGFNQRARVVYASAKTIIFDDLANPMFGQVDTEMQQMGQEFDAVTLPVENTNFGNPLAYDASLGNKGHVLIFFTSKVNTFVGGNLLGFVNSCDYYPYDVSGNPATQDTVTNEAPIFYAMVPTTGGTGVHSVKGWHQTLRPVLAHETKHIVSYAEKFQRNAMSLEDSWLEEATAQTASEIYGRTYTGATWKGNNPYATTVRCEVVLPACTGDHPAVMTHHFGWLMDYLTNFTGGESPTADQPEAYYGGSWNFVRYAVDQYAPVEADILQAITQTTTVFGTANLALRTGVAWPTMVTRWNTAIALAQYGIVPADPLLTIPSWDMKGIYNGLNVDWSSAFTTPYPLAITDVAFTGFRWGGTLPGSGAAVIRLTGSQATPFLLTLLNPNNTLPTSINPLRLGIVRTQ